MKFNSWTYPHANCTSLGRRRSCNSTTSTLYVEDTKGVLWKLGKDGLKKDIRLRRRFLGAGLTIPELSQLNLAHPHTRRTTVPINTLMDYMTSSQEFYKQLTEGIDITDAGKAAKEASNKVSNWITSQVWDPIKKYGTLALAIILSLITIVIIWKIYKCACQSENRQPSGDKVVVVPMQSVDSAPLMKTTSL